MPLSPGATNLAGPSSGGKEMASHWALGCRTPWGGSPQGSPCSWEAGAPAGSSVTHPPEGHARPQPPHQLTSSQLTPGLPHPFPRGLRGKARSLGGRGRRAHAWQPACRPGYYHGSDGFTFHVHLASLLMLNTLSSCVPCPILKERLVLFSFRTLC